MEDVETTVGTGTTSRAASYSQAVSEESTRASTPTEVRAGDISADSLTRPLLQNDDDADDVTMKDTNQTKSSPTGVRDDLSNSKVVSWPSATVIDPGSSPWMEKKPQEEFVDYENPPAFYDPDEIRLYKP